MKNLAYRIRCMSIHQDEKGILALCDKLDAIGVTEEELGEINYAVNNADDVEDRRGLCTKIEKLKQLEKACK